MRQLASKLFGNGTSLGEALTQGYWREAAGGRGKAAGHRGWLSAPALVSLEAGHLCLPNRVSHPALLPSCRPPPTRQRDLHSGGAAVEPRRCGPRGRAHRGGRRPHSAGECQRGQKHSGPGRSLHPPVRASSCKRGWLLAAGCWRCCWCAHFLHRLPARAPPFQPPPPPAENGGARWLAGGPQHSGGAHAGVHHIRRAPVHHASARALAVCRRQPAPALFKLPVKRCQAPDRHPPGRCCACNLCRAPLTAHRSVPPLPCADALRPVGDAERRERFSFALARTLDFGPERLQQLMYSQVCWAWLKAGPTSGADAGAVLASRRGAAIPGGAALQAAGKGGPCQLTPRLLPARRCLQSTAERLRAAEELVLEGRAWLAARSTLRDAF